MRRFARLLEALAFTPRRSVKQAQFLRYFATTPDPDRGYALAALTGDLELRQVTPSLLRTLISERMDPELFALSYDYVGDLAETIALAWPDGAPDTVRAPDAPPLSALITELQRAGRADLPAMVAGRLDALGMSERYAYLKLATGGLRVGVSGRLARVTLAEFIGVDVAEVEELWHGMAPPYTALFQWADGGPRPEPALASLRPVMLATGFDDLDPGTLDPADFAAEWKWDGVRVQAVAEGGVQRLYTRTGQDISATFPDLLERLVFDGVIDGELLIRTGDRVAPFSELQKRLNRKRVSGPMMARLPAALRAYDLLLWQGRDLRAEPFATRRAALEDAVRALDDPRIDLSALLSFDTWEALAALRAAPPDPVIEGVMIKRRASPYLAGRVKGHWFKWKRDPMVVDAVLMYAQRGHGKRSGYYSDFTFGLWDGDALVPVGKAYFGFTDAELRDLDRFVRDHTTDRFGPVRAVAPQLVLEIAFEGLNRSTRHKSGVAMRFPRIARIRTDKPAAEADRLEHLRALLPPELG